MSALDLFRVVGAAVSDAADRVHLQLRGLGMDGDNESSEPVDNAVHVQPLGLFARAVVAQSLRVIGWRRGDEVVALSVWNKRIAQDPAVDAGETRVYAVGEPKVCLRVGPVNIELRVNVGGTVKLAPDAVDYAGKAVARKDDAVMSSALFASWLTTVGAATGAGAPPTTIGSINSGASKVLA